MAKTPHTSTHRVGKRLVKVPRRFDQAHLDAGYHKQEHGEHSTPDHDLHGVYRSPSRGEIIVDHVEGEPEFAQRCPCGATAPLDDDFEEHLRQEHDLEPEQMTYFLERGPHRVLVDGSLTVGPEFRIRLEDGSALTTLDADSVRDYLDQFAAERRPE